MDIIYIITQISMPEVILSDRGRERQFKVYTYAYICIIIHVICILHIRVHVPVLPCDSAVKRSLCSFVDRIILYKCTCIHVGNNTYMYVCVRA